MLENQETLSAFVVEPTLIAEETQAGDPIETGSKLLPDATTLAMPIARRWSMLGLYGSSSHGAANAPPPRLMLTATMFRPASATE